MKKQPTRCARSRCKGPGLRILGRDILLCVKHHATLGTGKAYTFRNRERPKVMVRGVERSFASGWEAERAKELLLLEDAGVIADLRFQVPFQLRIDNGKIVEEGGVLIETYIADAVYNEVGFKGIVFGPPARRAPPTVEDAKNGYLSPEFKRKKRWMKAAYGIETQEVHKKGKPRA